MRNFHAALIHPNIKYKNLVSLYFFIISLCYVQIYSIIEQRAIFYGYFTPCETATPTLSLSLLELPFPAPPALIYDLLVRIKTHLEVPNHSLRTTDLDEAMLQCTLSIREKIGCKSNKKVNSCCFQFILIWQHLILKVICWTGSECARWHGSDPYRTENILYIHSFFLNEHRERKYLCAGTVLLSNRTLFQDFVVI